MSGVVMRARVLADVHAHPGATVDEIAARLDVPHNTVYGALADLRADRVIATVGTLVPLPADLDAVCALGPALRVVYAWACDVVGSTEDYAAVHRIAIDAARNRITRLRQRGLLAPSAGCWTLAQVEAAQDAAWPAVAAVRGAA